MSNDFLSMFVNLNKRLCDYEHLLHHALGKYTFYNTIETVIEDQMHPEDFDSKYFVIYPVLLINS